MAGTPDDWSDWYSAGGRALTDLAAENPRVRTARLYARAMELATRLPEDSLEAWLALGERMGGAAAAARPARGQAGRA